MMNIYKVISENISAKYTSNPKHAIPDWSYECWLMTRDEIKIFSWWYHNQLNRRGTIFVLHGITNSSGDEYYWKKSKLLADKFGLWIGAIDFRGHGKSQNKVPSLGYAEAIDIEAGMDYADSINAPKPYILMGESYGGMVAQLTAITDTRVSAVICFQTPGWPWEVLSDNLTNYFDTRKSTAKAKYNHTLYIIIDTSVRS